MTCTATGRRPRTRRNHVAPGSSPVPVDLAVIDSPKTRDGCALAALVILASCTIVVVGGLYIAFQIARAVWS